MKKLITTLLSLVIMMATFSVSIARDASPPGIESKTKLESKKCLSHDVVSVILTDQLSPDIGDEKDQSLFTVNKTEINHLDIPDKEKAINVGYVDKLSKTSSDSQKEKSTSIDERLRAFENYKYLNSAGLKGRDVAWASDKI